MPLRTACERSQRPPTAASGRRPRIFRWSRHLLRRNWIWRSGGQMWYMLPCSRAGRAAVSSSAVAASQASGPTFRRTDTAPRDRQGCCVRHPRAGVVARSVGMVRICPERLPAVRSRCANLDDWMTETKNTGEKTLSVHPTKTLTLKREHGVVRQSFGHGRSKAVVVEKVKRRVLGPGEAKVAEPAAERAPGRAPRSSAAASGQSPSLTPAQAPKPSGVVLRTLTEEERSARAHALADARVREAEERRIAEEDARRRAERDNREQLEREAAEGRKREEEERRKHEEETKRKAEQEAKKRFGEEESKARLGLPRGAALE